MKPTVNILYLPGTNCQAESLRAFREVGAEPKLVFVNDALRGFARLDDADLLCLPGGFAFGDHIAGGTAAGLILRTHLRDQLLACLDRPVLAICNGFQIAVRAGVFGEGVALKTNSGGTFQNIPDQPHQVVTDNDSPWLTGLAGQTLHFPCAHGEGRFVHNGPTGWQPALTYPKDANPDGSTDNIAGITTPNGRVFGLMNHPERSMTKETRQAFFKNGIAATR